MNKLLALLILVVFFVETLAQDAKIFTAHDMWKIKRPSALIVSPDKENACFVLTEYDIEENKGNSDLWLINLTTYKTKRLTTNMGRDNSPVWHPNGRTIAFISKREGDEYAQVYEISIDGGEAEKIFDLPMGAGNPKYFNDGKKIAVVSLVLPEFEDDLEIMKKEVKKKRESKVTAKVTENRLYRYWDSWLTEGYLPRIFIYDFETQEKINLTKGLSMIFELNGGINYSISPEGKYLAFNANSTNPPYTELNSDVFMISTDGNGVLENITIDNPADDFNPFFSKDGRYLYYGKQNEKGFYADNVQLVQYDLINRQKKNLTENIDLSFSDFKEIERLNRIFVTTEELARSAVYSIDIVDGSIERILNRGNISSLNAGENKLYFIKDDILSPPELFEYDLINKELQQISFLNQDLMSRLKLGKYEEVYFKGANDQNVQMYIIYPPEYKEGVKYPLIHLIHGGPHGIFGDNFHFRWNPQLFAASGYFVAMVNFHGSTSFGKEFAKSIVGAHGELPFTDIMRANEFIGKNYPSVDMNRVGAAGGSYGGYLVNWIAGNSSGFKALVSHAGVYNLMAQFASDITHNRDKSYGGSPWEGTYEQMNKYNPAFYAHNFTSPMLIIHGEKDYRVPVTQGLEIYGILKAKGVDARLVYYPDENHWILSPQNSIYWYKEVLTWFDKYLK